MPRIRAGPSPGRHRRFWTAAGCCLCATVLFAVAVSSGLGGAWASSAVDNLGQLVAPLLAACACGWAAWRQPSTRTAWAFMAASSFCWGMGQVVWCYYELVRGVAAPVPSLADVGYLGAVPLAIVGLLAFPGGIRRATSRVRTLMDGLLISGSLLFMSWALVIGPIYQAHRGSLFKEILSMSYPATDVVLVSLVVVLAVQNGSAHRRSLVLVMAGIVAIAVSDTSFAYLTVANDYGVGSGLDTGWIVGYLLILLGALWSLGSTPPPSGDLPSDRVTPISVLGPYVFPAMAGGVAMARLVEGEPFGLFLALEGFLLLGLLATRQIVTLLDNVTLNRLLHSKVELGTAELRLREARFSALVEHSSDLITIVGEDSLIDYQSPSIHPALGWDAVDVEGTRLDDLLHVEDRSRWQAVTRRLVTETGGEVTVEWRLRRADDTWRVFQSVVTNLLDEASVAGYVINSRDVNDQRVLEDQLREQAFHDQLTGLANGALFAEHVEQALRRRTRNGGSLEVIIIDLDDFGAMNDRFGHLAGDELLTKVAARLQANLRDADAVARLGGDEFGVLFEGPTGVLTSGTPADRLVASFAEPFAVGSESVLLSASIGVAADDPDCVVEEDLMRRADLAMYAAKAQGKHAAVIYAPTLHGYRWDDVQLERDMRKALERGEFELHFQPIVDVATWSIAGVEALIRWNHPERGLVSPADFIPVAESSGLIVGLGEWVLDEACARTRHWTCRDGSPLRVSVNVSPRQLSDPRFPAVAEAIAAARSYDLHRITLEVTESLFADDAIGRTELLTVLRDAGMKVAIDDFGTGYSALAHLRDLPVDILKIDKSFIDHITDDADSARLVRTILQLAGDFHLSTVAEGAEQPGQVALLCAWGCPFIQGYYFSKPLPHEEMERLLHQDNPFASLPSFSPASRASAG